MAKKYNNSDKLPPQDLDAEQSVLGSILIDKESFYKIIDRILPQDFYLDAHKKVFETMIELAEKSKPLDILSVGSKLKEKNHLEAIGGQSALTRLVNSVPSASHIAHYADIVHKKFILRKLIESSHHIASLGYTEDEDVDILLDEAEQKIFQIANRANTQTFGKLKTSLEGAFERIDKLHKDEGELRGVPTGFSELDDLLAGLQKTDLVILAARPSLGKSALALDIARNVSTKHKIPVGIFSLEMSQDQIVDRFIAAEAGVDLWKLRTGRLSSKGEYNDFVKIQTALGELSEAPIFIDDGLTSSVLQMRAMARRLQTEHGLGLLIVDYIQLILPKTSTDNMVQQITEISRSLKALARELRIPVLAISQLSRAVEQRRPPIPKLSDLRESGALEQDADVVMFIYRDLTTDDPEKENLAEIHIAKHRNGPIGKINLFFDKNSASFRGLEKRQTTDAHATTETGEVNMGDIPS